MNVKLNKFIKIAFTLCCVLLISSSCTKEYYKEYYDNNPISLQLNFEDIKNTDWVWNDNNGRYEVIRDFPELTKSMYDNGHLAATVFIKDGVNELQTPLPYITTYSDGTNLYTETLSFDISYTDKSIAFYIQSSDLGRDDSMLPNLYQIKVSIVYDPTNN